MFKLRMPQNDVTDVVLLYYLKRWTYFTHYLVYSFLACTSKCQVVYNQYLSRLQGFFGQQFIAKLITDEKICHFFVVQETMYPHGHRT